ncbi:hypothetical protein COHA_006932 [Chlorella ohadii]|uniref:Response regulatory domain-containing protein n=1 Tax=Chlorella ohadii TaxID=2649997 RepID=A0AAD5DRN8_9CHLO|nr:hypothetical protein COHA_006932 [Chlorella ohadii]
MEGEFPKGLKVLLVDDGASLDHAEASLAQHHYDVRTANSVEAALACFAGGAVAFDCVLLEHGLLAPLSAEPTAAFFKQAAAVHAPVVLMAASPSSSAVLEGVRLGAVDFLERPLSQHKLRTLWQHKIRAMMRVANGGVLPRPPSCPQLTTAASGCDSLAPIEVCQARSAALPGVSCPATPSVQALSAAAPQPSSSQASGESAGLGTQPTAAAAGAAIAPVDRSDATSGADALTPASSLPAGGGLPVPSMLQPTPGFAAAPLACMRLGATADLLPSPLHWPALPSGMMWGTPVGCGVPPPLPGSMEQAAAAPPADLSIRWCAPGALPMAAATYELLLPEDFSLARPAAEAREVGRAGPGPLGLQLTISPQLLADINACMPGSQHVAPMAPPTGVPTSVAAA